MNNSSKGMRRETTIIEDLTNISDDKFKRLIRAVVGALDKKETQVNVEVYHLTKGVTKSVSEEIVKSALTKEAYERLISGEEVYTTHCRYKRI